MALPFCSPRPCGVGAGRYFSIDLVGFWCEMGIDAWVGVCMWGALPKI